MRYTKDEIRARIDQFCSAQVPYIFSDDKELLQEMIRDLAREDTLETRALLLASIYKMSTITGTGRDDAAMLFSSVGLSAFQNGENDIAEEFFRIAVEISDDLTSKNNLAYIIRKKGKLTKDGKKDVIGFLTEGVRNKEPYSLINMAMLFSIELGGEKDWIIADELMSLVGNGSSAESWWQELGEKDDPEGYLVLLWLLRHHTITDSVVGSVSCLWDKVHAAYPNAPSWLKDDAEPAFPAAGSVAQASD